MAFFLCAGLKRIIKKKRKTFHPLRSTQNPPHENSICYFVPVGVVYTCPCFECIRRNELDHPVNPNDFISKFHVRAPLILHESTKLSKCCCIGCQRIPRRLKSPLLLLLVCITLQLHRMTRFSNSEVTFSQHIYNT